MFLNACVSVLGMCMWMQVPIEARGSDSSRAGVIGDCELFKNWEPNSGPVQEQHILLTTELSF